MTWLWSAVIAANFLLAIFVIASILRRQKEPTAMLAWVFAIVLMPFAGSILYWLVGSTRIHRKAHRRRKRIAHLVSRVKRHTRDRAGGDDREAEQRLPDDLATVERMTRRLLGVPATSGNQVHVYEEANATYYALEEAIRDARESVHLEYYVWQPDDTGRHFRDLVIEKAKTGVKCRLLLDAVGSWRIGRSFTQPLIEAGVQLAFFLPVNPLRKRWSINLRNHRKIAVIDGRVAFMGSQNIGDEYLGRLKRLSPWRDTHMRVIGPAVLFMQQTFVEDWLFASGENLTSAELFPDPARSGDGADRVRGRFNRWKIDTDPNALLRTRPRASDGAATCLLSGCARAARAPHAARSSGGALGRPQLLRGIDSSGRGNLRVRRRRGAFQDHHRGRSLVHVGFGQYGCPQLSAQFREHGLDLRCKRRGRVVQLHRSRRAPLAANRAG